MRGLNLLQLVGGVAVAGTVAAGSTALTGSGLTNNVSDQFVGGTVSQNITGASLDTATYSYTADASKTQITQVVLALTGAAGKAFTFAPTAGSFGGTATKWVCDDGHNTGTTTIGTLYGTAGSASTNSVTCKTTDSGGATNGYVIGLSNISVQIA